MICRYDNGNCLCQTCVNNPIDNLRSACRDCNECRQAGHKKHNIGLCSDYTPMVETKKPKEKQCVKPFHKCNGSEYTLIEDSHFDFCPYCGKPIDWNEGDPE